MADWTVINIAAVPFVGPPANWQVTCRQSPHDDSQVGYPTRHACSMAFAAASIASTIFCICSGVIWPDEVLSLSA